MTEGLATDRTSRFLRIMSVHYGFGFSTLQVKALSGAKLTTLGADRGLGLQDGLKTISNVVACWCS